MGALLWFLAGTFFATLVCFRSRSQRQQYHKLFGAASFSPTMGSAAQMSLSAPSAPEPKSGPKVWKPPRPVPEGSPPGLLFDFQDLNGQKRCVRIECRPLG